jgi:hypothetical protein
VNALYEDPTQESRDLLQLAHDLARECPAELGEEILVVGSAGWGCADTHSDLDMEFWVESLPNLETATAWLEATGAVDLMPDTESGEGEINVICRYAGIWLEAGWRELTRKEKLVQAVATGQDTARSSLLEVGNIVHVIPVRTSGALNSQQERLFSYPDVVREQVILDASAFWKFPHRVEALWILARRQEVLGLTTWLLADISDALRILFAINRQWETDWKHLRKASSRLAVQPDNLTERVGQVFSAQPLERRVAAAMRLILDILKLVPSGIDVTKAMLNIQQSLAANIFPKRS